MARLQKPRILHIWAGSAWGHRLHSEVQVPVSTAGGRPLAFNVLRAYNQLESGSVDCGFAPHEVRGGGIFAAGAIAVSASSLNSNVLLLNAHYMALRVVSVRNAFRLLFKRDEDRHPVAEVVSVEDGRYVTYDFEDWAELSAFEREFQPQEHDWIRTVRYHLLVPRVVRVLNFSKLPRCEVKFNRRNIFARDKNTCQYCGRQFNSSELSLDHVVPRSRGGTARWNNIVCACVKCNVRKGGRTPDEASLRLIKPPRKPRRNPVIGIKLSDKRYASWKHFLDAAYWDVELR